MKIYNLEEAKRTVLKRKALHRMDYSPLTLQRTEKFFGKGITPPKAVEIILRSVEDEGDKAIKKWSKTLDGYKGNEILIPKASLENAWDQLDPKLQKGMQLAASRIRKFHQKQPVESWISTDMIRVSDWLAVSKSCGNTRLLSSTSRFKLPFSAITCCTP